MGLGVLVTVAVIVLVAVLLTVRGAGSGNQAARTSGAAAIPPAPTTAVTSPEGSSTAPQTSPQPATTAPSVVAALPSTQAHIDLTRIADFPDVTEVAQLLDTYFTGINTHDVNRAVSVFAANGVVNPNDPRQVAAFGRGISTSQDDHIVVLSVSPADFDGESGLAVRTTFRSRQAASLGPDNQTCTNWSLTEKLVSVGNGYQLLGSQDVRHSSC